MNPNNMAAGVPEQQNNDMAIAETETVVSTVPVAETPASDVAVGAEAIVASEEIAESAGPLKADDKVSAGDMTDGVAPKKKGGKGLILAVVLLTIVALGGIGFGVWGMMDGNAQKDKLESSYKEQISSLKQQNDKLTEELNEASKDGGGDTIINIDTDGKYIDNNLAQNLINPYINPFNYLSNMFDCEFNDDAKVEIAYQNLEPNDIFELTSSGAQVHYNVLNRKYQELFGADLGKRDYQAGHSDSFKITDDGKWFEISRYAGGGTALGMITAVKNAQLDEEEIAVYVYHEVVAVCSATDDEYCISAPRESYIGNSMSDTVVKEFVEKFTNRIPVYKMTFVKNNGHYVLSNVEKQ